MRNVVRTSLWNPQSGLKLMPSQNGGGEFRKDVQLELTECQIVAVFCVSVQPDKELSLRLDAFRKHAFSLLVSCATVSHCKFLVLSRLLPSLFCFLFLQACPCKTHCVGSRDERQLAHAFPTCPHCSLSVPVLFGTGRLARQDIRSPLRRRGPRQTVLRGARAARRKQAAHYDRETDAGCGVVCFCWKAIVSPVCGRQGCRGAVSNGHC